MLYRIYNYGEFKNLGTGCRTVVALAPGRKWITVVDWTDLSVQDIDLRTWHQIKPEPVGRSEGYRKTYVLKHMREQLQYKEETKAIREAIDTLQAA